MQVFIILFILLVSQPSLAMETRDGHEAPPKSSALSKTKNSTDPIQLVIENQMSPRFFQPLSAASKCNQEQANQNSLYLKKKTGEQKPQATYSTDTLELEFDTVEWGDEETETDLATWDSDSESTSGSEEVPVFKDWILTKMQNSLAKEGLELGLATDDGDCFYHAFSQGLEKLGVKVKIEELRKAVLDRILSDPSAAKIARNQPEFIKDDRTFNEEDYAEYLKRLPTTFERAKANGSPLPEWGRPHIEGEILAQIYNVQIQIYSNGVLDRAETIANLKAIKKLKYSDEIQKVQDSLDQLYFFGPSKKFSVAPDRLIQIGNVNDHFIPLRQERKKTVKQ